MGQVTVINARGDDYADISVRETSFVKVKKVTAEVFDADGKRLYKREKKDLLKSCGFGGYSLYEDDCNFYGELTAPRYPYSVEISIEYESSSLAFWRSATLQHFIPVNRASYALTVPSGMENLKSPNS